MAYRSLKEFAQRLEQAGELKEIGVFANPVLEISEITDRVSKSEGGGTALLFTDNGTRFPVLMNAMGSYRRICMALGVRDLDDIGTRMNTLFDRFTTPGAGLMQKLSVLPQLGKLASFFPVHTGKKAPCQEVVHMEPDLGILPILKTWPYDGGRFITLPVVHTIDPRTGERNAGMYRMQVFDARTTGMHWHRHKTGAAHYEAWKMLGRRMPVAVALGGDPVYTYAATAPLPANIDEYLFAGFLREKSVPMVRCLTQDIEVPADADFILEGYVDPEEELRTEGPFGDHTGFYSLEDEYPVFHLTCITHRSDAIYPSTIVGIPPQEDAWIARATERIFLMPVRKTVVPELTDMEIPEFGVAHNLMVVQIEKSWPGQARKVMNALWGAGQMMFNKILVVADDMTDIHDPAALLARLRQIDPLRDIFFSSGPLDVLDHSAEITGFGSKAGIDITKKLKEELLTRIDVQQSDVQAPFTDEKLRGFISRYVNEAPEEDLKGYCLMNIRKKDDYSFDRLCSSLIASSEFSDCTFFIVTDDFPDPENFREYFWYVLNNLEPQRDFRILKDPSGHVRLFADGTAKTRTYDGFVRPWPNPIVMDDDTINRVDRRWEEYKLGKLPGSPSGNFKKFLRGDGAVAHDQ